MSALRTMALVSALLVGLTACEEASQPPAQSQAKGPVEVAVTTVTARRLPVSTELPGRTTAYRVAEIRPQVDGIIRERLFHEGSEVTAGQPLYQIDPKPYQAALASAKAELQRARADLTATAAKARRYGELVESSAVSRQNFDDAVAAQKQSEAAVAAAEAALEAAQINLDYTVVRSPISGRIGKSAVTEGALVTANQETALSVVQQLDPIYVDLTQSLSQLQRLRREIEAGNLARNETESGKAPVTLVLDGDDSEHPHRGMLLFSDVTVERDTNTVQLRAVFPNPDLDLLPGMFVRARVDQGVRENAILVPQQSVTRTPDGRAMVWLVGEDGTVAPRPIETDRAVADAWLVESGLQPGDRIVVEGVQKIAPGAKVSTVPSTVELQVDRQSAARGGPVDVSR